MEGAEFSCFQIISRAGEARSLFVEGMELAKEGKFEDAEKKLNEGADLLVECHKYHAELLTGDTPIQEAEMLVMHAEDLMMSAETIRIFAEQLIDLTKKLEKCTSCNENK